MSTPDTGEQSPWVAHFRGLCSPEKLKAMTTCVPEPLHGLNLEPVEVACKRVFDALTAIYIPGPVELGLLLQMVEMALAHAQQWYPDGRTFLRNIYSETIDMPSAVPVCLIGLSGVGKSALRRALCKVFEPPSSLITVADDHSEFPWAPMGLALIKRAQSSTEVQRALCGRRFGKFVSIDATGDWMYRTGDCFNVLDEMQYLTHGESSRATVLKVLLTVAGLGVPMLYICNFSLCYRLLKLSHEARQAVLANVRLLPPSLPESPEWLAYLAAAQATLPGICGFSLVSSASVLWNYTAGLKRNLQYLLLAAYRLMRKDRTATITWQMVEAAYESSYYFASREEVELLIAHAATGKIVRRDLICPFEMEANEDYKRVVKELHRQIYARAVGRTALSKSEKDALAELQVQSEPKAPKESPRQAAALQKPKKTPVTSASLVDAGNALVNAKPAR